MPTAQSITSDGSSQEARFDFPPQHPFIRRALKAAQRHGGECHYTLLGQEYQIFGTTGQAKAACKSLLNDLRKETRLHFWVGSQLLTCQHLKAVQMNRDELLEYHKEDSA